VHGAYRARSDADRLRRLAFIEELCRDVPVHPVTLEIARRIGRIEAQQATIGISLAFEVLVVGVTGYHLEVAHVECGHLEAKLESILGTISYLRHIAKRIFRASTHTELLSIKRDGLCVD